MVTLNTLEQKSVHCIQLNKSPCNAVSLHLFDEPPEWRSTGTKGCFHPIYRLRGMVGLGAHCIIDIRYMTTAWACTSAVFCLSSAVTSK